MIFLHKQSNTIYKVESSEGKYFLRSILPIPQTGNFHNKYYQYGKGMFNNLDHLREFITSTGNYQALTNNQYSILIELLS